jgi:enoyl-CoA hydratase/carnithine racemase
VKGVSVADSIIVKQESGILSLTLNRPECGNLITMEMIATLRQSLLDLSSDTRVVVLRANGPDFCKGRDYQQAPEDARDNKVVTAAHVRDNMTAPILGMYTAINVPTISVVQGAAAGFGCALACSCDIVLAGPKARFALPEMRERGLPPTLAMTALIDRVSFRALTYLVYSTVEIDAQNALMSGFASAVLPDIESQSQDVIDRVASIPPETVRSVNRYLKMAPAMEPSARAELGSNLYAVTSSSLASAKSKTK